MNALLEVRKLSKKFPTSSTMFGKTHDMLVAVDDVNLSISAEETVGLVGESGCGKTTTGRLILRLLEPTSGEVIFKGRNILNLTDEVMRKTRSSMQIIFQDPYASLNPRQTVSEILRYPFDLHEPASKSATNTRITSLLLDVGLTPPEQFMHRYPHQLSGGQRQRVVIARAIALKPSLVVADEPVSSLDLSLQVQILNLLREVREQLGMSLLFISHDLSVVRFISQRVAVMYLGRIVEMAKVDDLFSEPLHPYTMALLSAMPVPDPELMHTKKRILLEGDPPSPINIPPGCRFYSRCLNRRDRCKISDPQLVDFGNNHYVACHLQEA